MLFGVSEGRCDVSSGLSQPGEKAVEQSGGAGSDTRYRLPEGRSWKNCGGGVGVLHDTFALLEHRVRKMSRMEGRGHQ